MATMPNIGPLELAIVLIIALVIFGPKRLPELGRSLGNGLREFKSSVTGENKDDDPRQIENGVEEDPVSGASVGDAASTERESRSGS
jgi:sec-independent protein translocase protein TatA